MATNVHFSDDERKAVEKVCTPLSWSQWVHSAVKEKLDRQCNEEINLSHASIEKLTQKIIERQNGDKKG